MIPPTRRYTHTAPRFPHPPLVRSPGRRAAQLRRGRVASCAAWSPIWSTDRRGACIMSATSDFYRAQADKCQADADGSALTQVRDRNLRAAAAWRAMADKLVRTETARAEKLKS